MLPSNVLEVRYYIAEDGRSPFAEWFAAIDPMARARIATALERLEQGNTSGLKSLSGGLHELRMHFGPGYRVYLGRDGPRLVVILVGGTKQRQQRDIEFARILWENYKRLSR